jgi:hypothetical protein
MSGTERLRHESPLPGGLRWKAPLEHGPGQLAVDTVSNP